MNKRNIKVFIFIITFIIFISIYKMLIIPYYLKYENIYLSAFLSIYTFLLYVFIGIEKEIRTKDKRIVEKKTIINLIIYFIIIYSLGIYLGFTYNGMNYNINNFINIIILQIIISIDVEIIRYIIINSLKSNTIITLIITLLLIILELLTSINLYRFNSILGIYTFISESLIPICIKNYTLSYLAKNKILRTNIILRLISDTYLLILPIIPNLKDYLLCMSNILLPFSIYITTSKVFNKNIIYKKSYFSDIFFSILAIILIVLVSGFTRFKLISVASNSMSPIIKRGDSVIIEEYKDTDNIEVGDIIAYQNESGLIIVHRILEVHDNSYVTKGDFNNTKDINEVYKDNILGHVVLKVPYIGYPSIWLSENTGGI